MRPFGITVLSLILVSLGETAKVSLDETAKVPAVQNTWQRFFGAISGTNAFKACVADPLITLAQNLITGRPATPSLSLNSYKIEVSATDQDLSYDHNDFYLKVCLLSLDGFTVNDLLSLIVKNNNGPGQEIQFKLLDILFKSAIVTNNKARIDDLIAENIHLHLTDVEKVGFFKLVLGKFNKTVQPEINIDREILILLLKNNFYIPNHELKEKGYMVYDWDCPLYSVIADPGLVIDFQNVDSDFFRKETKCNYVKRAIRFSEYDMAKKALNAGCKPEIVDEDGLNALDEFMANTVKPEHANCFTESIINIQNLLKSVYPSFDLKNLKRCCFEKRFKYAVFILDKAKEAKEFNDAKTCEEVINIALKTRDVSVSVKALELCLDKLPASKIPSLMTVCLNEGTSIPTEIHGILENRLNHALLMKKILSRKKALKKAFKKKEKEEKNIKE